ncbi:MAG: hypothetical protein Q8L81_12860 [Bacteroidota bacterium]|nr:hypothetical protein [Bacteroidota bacterium]
MPIVLRSIKAKIFFLALLYCITIALVSWSKSSPTGPHGGTLKKSGNYFIEMKNPDKFFYAYLLDKKLNSINNKNVSGEVKFLMPDSTSFNVTLKAATDDGFTCESLPGSYACRVTFIVFGKSVSARFENPALLVEKK